MAKLQCPKCKQTIEISQLPADNRVTCGSCKAQFSLKVPATTSPTATKSNSGQTTKPPAAKTAGAVKPTGVSASASKPSSPAKKSTPAKTTAAPAVQTLGAIDLAALGKGKRVDLGVAPISSAPAESPQGNMAPWLAGNSAAYVPLSDTEVAAMTSDGTTQADGTTSANNAAAKSRSNLKVIIAVSTVLTLMLIGVIVAAVIAGNK